MGAKTGGSFQKSEVRRQRAETVSKSFLETESSHCFSAMKGIKIALNPVGAGDSPVRGNVRVSGQKGAAFGGFLCPPAGQISEIRNQRSDAVEEGFTQRCG